MPIQVRHKVPFQRAHESTSDNWGSMDGLHSDETLSGTLANTGKKGTVFQLAWFNQFPQPLQCIYRWYQPWQILARPTACAVFLLRVDSGWQKLITQLPLALGTKRLSHWLAPILDTNTPHDSTFLDTSPRHTVLLSKVIYSICNYNQTRRPVIAWSPQSSTLYQLLCHRWYV